MNPLQYGTLLEKFDNTYVIAVNNNTTAYISVYDNEKEKYNLIKFYKNTKFLYEWKDTFISDNSFKREIGKSIYTYENKEIK